LEEVGEPAATDMDLAYTSNLRPSDERPLPGEPPFAFLEHDDAVTVGTDTLAGDALRKPTHQEDVASGSDESHDQCRRAPQGKSTDRVIADKDLPQQGADHGEETQGQHRREVGRGHPHACVRASQTDVPTQ